MCLWPKSELAMLSFRSQGDPIEQDAESSSAKSCFALFELFHECIRHGPHLCSAMSDETDLSCLHISQLSFQMKAISLQYFVSAWHHKLVLGFFLYMMCNVVCGGLGKVHIKVHSTRLQDRPKLLKGDVP